MINSSQTSQWLNKFISNLLELIPLSDSSHLALDFLLKAAIIAFVAIGAHLIVRKIILHYVIKLTERTKKAENNFMFRRKVFHKLIHLIPASIIYVLAPIVLDQYKLFLGMINKIVIIYFIVMIFAAIQGAIRVIEDVYNTKPHAAERPIRTYTQMLILISYLIAALIIVSYIFDVQITKILAGMGAMAAVMMLVFKDTILGLVAGVQLSANEMVQVGDWIEMPAYNADGDVLEITLNTVKVQNWDRTITTIPTYAMVSSPFINWRGMQESGGRRIKRSINIDMRSVKFCTPEMLDKYKKIHYLKEYIEERQAEIEEYNETMAIDDSVLVNGRRMTNLGVFRKYLESYCSEHPKVNMNMTFLIRHLQPTEKGIPIEIYLFSADTRWAKYEELQADIFDHVLAVISEFELSVFQIPSGEDITSLHTIDDN